MEYPTEFLGNSGMGMANLSIGRYFSKIAIFVATQVSYLRDQVKSVDVFMLAFKQQDNRMSPALRSMIKLMTSMFGDKFWSNVVLVVNL